MEDTLSTRKKLPFGTKLWLGLATYVVVTDSYALYREKETLSEALSRALQDPKKRWMVSISWALTTKHLFFRNFLPQVDPYATMALGVGLTKKLGSNNGRSSST